MMAAFPSQPLLCRLPELPDTGRWSGQAFLSPLFAVRRLFSWKSWFGVRSSGSGMETSGHWCFICSLPCCVASDGLAGPSQHQSIPVQTGFFLPSASQEFLLVPK